MFQWEPIKISMLCPARPNSKFIAHLVMSFLNNTKDFYNTELLIMPALNDTWNKDLYEWVVKNPAIKVIPEDLQMGQKGHNKYLNELFKHSKGDWILNFCDDMNIVSRDWDERIRDFIRHKQLDPVKSYMLIPRFVITGAVEHILSRGWIEVVGEVAGYQNTDSWLNTVTDMATDIFRATRRLEIPGVLFEDYSNNESMKGLMELQYRPDNIKPVVVPDFKDDVIQRSIKETAKKLCDAMTQGR